MPNTTVERVRSIIEVDDTAPVQMAIDDANMVVTDVIGTALVGTRLEAVERWLAAHLLAAGPAQRTASESAKGLSESYQYQLGAGLATTMYGSQAMALDTSGKLAAWNKNMLSGRGSVRPGVVHLGADESTLDI